MTAMFRTALASDPQGLIDVIDMALQVWEPLGLVRWLETPQQRWEGKSPIDLIALGRADDVLDLLETFEVR